MSPARWNSASPAATTNRCPGCRWKCSIRRRSLRCRLTVVPPEYTHWPQRDARRDFQLADPGRLARGTVGRGQQAAALGRAAPRRRPRHSRPRGRRRAEVPRRRAIARSCRKGWCSTSRRPIRSGWSIATASAAARSTGSSACRTTPRRAWSSSSPRADLFVTPAARVDLRIDAHDDLGLRRVALVYSSSGASGRRRNDASPLRRAAAGASCRATAQRPTADDRPPLGPGGTETPARHAIDDLCRGDRLPPANRPQRAADAHHHHAGRIAGPPGRAAKPDRWPNWPACCNSSATPAAAVRSLEIRLHETGGLEQADIDRLQSAEFNQREVVRGLTDRGDGLPALVLSVLADLDMNRIDNPDLARRMQGLLDELRPAGARAFCR